MTTDHSDHFDFDLVDPNAVEPTGPAYPVAQWHNGRQAMRAIGGVQHTGGMILPIKYLPDGFKLPGWAVGTFTFAGGNEESGLSSQRPVVAAIRTRFRWFVTKSGVTTFYPRSSYEDGIGMRGHLQVLAALQGCEYPIAITFKGKASQSMETLIKQFTGRVVQAANRNAPPGRALPRYAFWMTLAPGGFVKAGRTGQESTITPPTLVLPDQITVEFLRSIYIGRDNLLRFQNWFCEADTWAKSWDAPGTEYSDEDAAETAEA